MRIITAGTHSFCAGVMILTIGCSSPLPVQPMPDNVPRLPAASSSGEVWIEGRFYINHEAIFGLNLLEAGYVPIAVRMFLRDNVESEEDSRISLDDVKPELYLPDGAKLEFISYDRIQLDLDTVSRITEEALDINVIKPESQSKEGFIFFKLPTSEFLIRDADTLVHLEELLPHEVRISESLLALEYFTDDRNRPLYVGLRRDRRSVENR